MQKIINNTLRNLDVEEWRAIMDAAQILEKAFKRKLFQCNVNPPENNPDDVWGISFGFDMMSGFKEGKR